MYGFQLPETLIMSPFEYLNAINQTKKPIIVDEESEKEYQPFIVNRSLSYFPDTVRIANEMNIHHQIDNKLQFDFLINIIRPRKRFAKWVKSETIDDVEAVMEYYGYSKEKAINALSLLTTQHLDNIKKKVDKGGRK